MKSCGRQKKNWTNLIRPFHKCNFSNKKMTRELIWQSLTFSC
jgi:hypothetical protein